MHEQTRNKLHYLYRVTNQVNGKIYIGQTVQPDKRWNQHRRDAAEPKVPFHHAIKKHGAHNFTFEVIATCKSFDDANELETLLVKQYDSYVFNRKGYNATHGGFNVPKSEEWKQKMRDWHAGMTSEEKAARSQFMKDWHASLSEEDKVDQRQQMIDWHASLSEEDKAARSQFMTDWYSSLSEEEKVAKSNHLSELRTGNPLYSGHKQTTKTIEKRLQSIAETTKQRHEREMAEGKWKCSAPDCEVSGPPESGGRNDKRPDKYGFYDGKRYCIVHLGRLKYHGTTEKLPPYRWIGREAPNKHRFTHDQILNIMKDPRSSAKVGLDLGVTEKVILRIRRENFDTFERGNSWYK